MSGGSGGSGSWGKRRTHYFHAMCWVSPARPLTARVSRGGMNWETKKNASCCIINSIANKEQPSPKQTHTHTEKNSKWNAFEGHSIVFYRHKVHKKKKKKGAPPTS